MRAENMPGSLATVEEVQRFCVDVFMNLGVNKDFAQQTAESLVAADYRGHFCHGVNRLAHLRECGCLQVSTLALPALAKAFGRSTRQESGGSLIDIDENFVKDIIRKSCDANARPSILRETAATAWVDGNNGLGPVVANFCMELAIQKAKKSGIGWVVAKGSNNFGIAMWYCCRALEYNMVGMAFTNAPPLMCPTRAKTAALGTNPIAMAAPGTKGDSFILDMATTAASLGKIEMQLRKGEPIPEGWALDGNGKPTTDPKIALEQGSLLPLGGDEATSGYKGYGLALMVETLCGILGGANYGPYIKKYKSEDTRPANLGHCFVVINPDCFAPGFNDRLSNLLNALRGMEPADPKKPVLVPGDPERAFMKQVDKQGGIRYHHSLLKSLEDIAKQVDVKPINLYNY